MGGSLWNYWYVSGVWNASELVASGVVSVPVAILQPDGSPSVFFQGTGGSLWNYWYANGTWDAAEITPTGVASTPAAIESTDGPSVFFEGPGNSLLNFWYIPSDGSWGSATVGVAGTAFSAPAARQIPYFYDGPSVLVDGPQSSLVEYNYYSGIWYGTTVGGPGPADSSPALSPFNGVFFVGWLNSLDQLGSGGPELQIAGTGTAFSAPVVISQTDGDPSVFVVGPGNSLLNFWEETSAPLWGAATVGGPGSATGLIGVVAQPDGFPSVFFEAPGGALWNSWYVNGTWDTSKVAVGLAPASSHISS